MPIKIALVGFHLTGGGGARVMANLSNYFDKQGIEVHNIIFHNELGYHYSGRLFNLGELKSESNTIVNKVKRFYHFRNYIQKHDFDFIIDFRFRKQLLEEYLISRFIYQPKKTVYTIHSSKLDVYLPKSKFWTRVLYRNCLKLVTLTDEMKKDVANAYPGLNNIVTINNPIDLKLIAKNKIEEIDLDYSYIIAAGTYDTNVKQFDKLIMAYANSVLKNKDIHLVILGTGKLLNMLKSIAEDYNVKDHVHFLGFQSNPFKFFSKAKFFVLTSEYEGLPLVIIEALSCGIPVVSFNCPTGPSEVIQDKDNGLLVEHQDIDKLISAMNLMIENEELYNHCKSNARDSVAKYNIEEIGPHWLNVFKNSSEEF